MQTYRLNVEKRRSDDRFPMPNSGERRKNKRKKKKERKEKGKGIRKMRLECPFQNIATRVFKNRIFIQESVNRGDQTEIYRGEIRFFRKDSGRWPRSRNCSCRDNASNNANWFLVPFSRDDTLFIDTIWTRCSIYRVTISHENFIGKLGKRTWREGGREAHGSIHLSLPPSR